MSFVLLDLHSFSFEALIKNIGMKKLFLSVAFSFAGLLSAKTEKIISPIKTQNINLSCSLSIWKPIIHDWVSVTTGCGKVFYLDGNDYKDCYECLQEDARQFTDAQCGEGYGFDLPY